MEKTPIKIEAYTDKKLPEIDSPDYIRYCPICGKVIPPDQKICPKCAAGSRRKLPIPLSQLYLIAILALLLTFAIVFGFLLAPKTPEPVHRPLGTSIPVVIIEP